MQENVRGINSCKSNMKQRIHMNNFMIVFTTSTNTTVKISIAPCGAFMTRYKNSLIMHNKTSIHTINRRRTASHTTKHSFTCQAQRNGFKELLESIAKRPQDYVTLSGRMTTNTVEGFYGVALMYLGKQTDLEHRHYICKTNMSVCHKTHSQTLNKCIQSFRTLDQSGKCSVWWAWGFQSLPTQPVT